jgi:hypothetical protein
VKPGGIGRDELIAQLEVPGVVALDEDAGLGRERVERREA